MKARDAGEQTHTQFVVTNEENIAFGYGKRTCPSRFFAGVEIKITVAKLLVEYDISMPDGLTKRYAQITHGNVSTTGLKKEVVQGRIATKLSFSSGLQFYDVYSIDDTEFVTHIPRPALTLLALGIRLGTPKRPKKIGITAVDQIRRLSSLSKPLDMRMARLLLTVSSPILIWQLYEAMLYY
ncbi:hypothetical protein GGP41_004467 [Bipolaris sorokiniana]|uniref:Cytochrome P450 n=1 Tax=Cochliobolus sativus TaxID=45130 RepID=A0A8H5ZP50_COCSA|nr:hypothetical protein GGP41_004467 [Bipolaris sorokiniana]